MYIVISVIFNLISEINQFQIERITFFKFKLDVKVLCKLDVKVLCEMQGRWSVGPKQVINPLWLGENLHMYLSLLHSTLLRSHDSETKRLQIPSSIYLGQKKNAHK